VKQEKTMLGIAGIRALAYRKGCRLDRSALPAKWRLDAGNGALSSRPLGYREAYVVLMAMPDVRAA
jgi:hypothetical protein